MTKFSFKLLISLGFLILLSFFIANGGLNAEIKTKYMSQDSLNIQDSIAVATFGAGCFWCVEAVFEELKGVQQVKSGFSGGFIKNPAYREVISGRTGHAEVCQIFYKPSEVDYKTLLEVFWQTHDPTTLNRQGNDVGTQYRSIILTHNDEQENLAKKYKESLDKSGAFEKPIVTEIKEFEAFYEAEEYHQNYYQSNKNAPYCTYVIKPKMEKFKKAFADKIKP